MPGPAPKDPKLRQRRNKTTTASTLLVEVPRPPAKNGGKKSDQNEGTSASIPELPARAVGEVPWHPETIVFWREVWASPMAAEFIAADVPGLVIVARLVDRFNYGDVGLAAEIRLQRQCFGLTPLDRRRLQWEIERVEAAERRKPATTQPIAQRKGARDPRSALRAVK